MRFLQNFSTHIFNTNPIIYNDIIYKVANCSRNIPINGLYLKEEQLKEIIELFKKIGRNIYSIIYIYIYIN